MSTRERSTSTLLTVIPALMLSAVVPSATSAQPPDDATEPEIKEVVVVTASRVEESVDDSPMHVTVLEESELRASAAVTVDDAATGAALLAGLVERRQGQTS